MSFTIDKNCLCVVYDDDEKRTLGTGFIFMKENWIVTAKHVVIKKDGLPRNNLKIGFLDSENANVKVVAVHPELDLAFLIQDGDGICKAPLMPGHHKFSGNEGLFYIGYSPEKSDPGGSVVEVNHIKKYEIEERHRSDVETLLHFEADYAEGGNSGGPILDSGGSVIAVIIQKYEDNCTTYCRATDINIILKNIEFGNKWQAIEH